MTKTCHGYGRVHAQTDPSMEGVRTQAAVSIEERGQEPAAGRPAGIPMSVLQQMASGHGQPRYAVGQAGKHGPPAGGAYGWKANQWHDN